MNQSMHVVRGFALLAVGLGLCLISGTAQAQRGGGRGGGVQSTRAASSTGQTGGGSGMQGGCPNGGSSSSTTSSTGTTTGTTTSGVSTQSGQVTAQSVGTVTAQRTAANSAVVQYSGSTASVQRVYLAVLDANGGVVSQRAVVPSKAYATLALSSSARYYGAMIVYANGTSRTTFTPVR